MVFSRQNRAVRVQARSRVYIDTRARQRPHGVGSFFFTACKEAPENHFGAIDCALNRYFEPAALF